MAISGRISSQLLLIVVGAMTACVSCKSGPAISLRMKYRLGEVLRYRTTEVQGKRAPLVHEIDLRVRSVEANGDAEIDVRTCAASRGSRQVRHYDCRVTFSDTGYPSEPCNPALSALPLGLLPVSPVALGEEWTIGGLTSGGAVAVKARVVRNEGKSVLVIAYRGSIREAPVEIAFQGEGRFDRDAGAWISGRVEYSGALRMKVEFHRVEESDRQKAICEPRVGKLWRKECRLGSECADGVCKEIPDYCTATMPCLPGCEKNPLKCVCRNNRCGPDCDAENPCEAGRRCKGNRCVP
jgi:hypothetical protein